MIKKIKIQNYRIFQNFELDLQSGMNIIVGDNDCGKSTLLEAVSLALTKRLKGTPLEQMLSPYLFNAQTTKTYLAALRAGGTPTPPEIIIDLFTGRRDSTGGAQRHEQPRRGRECPRGSN